MNKVAEEYLLETLKSLKGLKSTAEKAFAQIDEEDFHFQPDQDSNSIAIIMNHIAGNMISRFTDFLISDGEKPWRDRDSEFVERNESGKILMARWETGWDCLLKTVSELKEEDLLKSVTIRNEVHTVLRALNRQLSHYAYHTGQIVYICKLIKKTGFRTLSIPKKQQEKNV